MTESAGVVLYRRRGEGIEVLVAHPGGPFWRGKETGAWSIPKGELDDGEDARTAAVREFAEETGHRLDANDLEDLGTVVQRNGKIVHAFAAEGDLDPASVSSNTFAIEWPPRSGRFVSFPEIDRVAWVSPEEAERLLNPAQAPLVRRLLETIDHAQ